MVGTVHNFMLDIFVAKVEERIMEVIVYLTWK